MSLPRYLFDRIKYQALMKDKKEDEIIMDLILAAAFPDPERGNSEDWIVEREILDD